MKIFRRKLPRKKKKKKKEAPCEVMAGLFEDVSLPLSFRVVHPTAKNKMKQVPGPEKWQISDVNSTIHLLRFF